MIPNPNWVSPRAYQAGRGSGLSDEQMLQLAIHNSTTGTEGHADTGPTAASQLLKMNNGGGRTEEEEEDDKQMQLALQASILHCGVSGAGAGAAAGCGAGFGAHAGTGTAGRARGVDASNGGGAAAAGDSLGQDPEMLRHLKQTKSNRADRADRSSYLMLEGKRMADDPSLTYKNEIKTFLEKQGKAEADRKGKKGRHAKKVKAKATVAGEGEEGETKDDMVAAAVGAANDTRNRTTTKAQKQKQTANIYNQDWAGELFYQSDEDMPFKIRKIKHGDRSGNDNSKGRSINCFVSQQSSESIAAEFVPVADHFSAGYVLGRAQEYRELGAQKAAAFGKLEVMRTSYSGLDRLLNSDRNKASLEAAGVDTTKVISGIWSCGGAADGADPGAGTADYDAGIDVDPLDDALAAGSDEGDEDYDGK
jgi:hypothetical protein